MKQLLIIYFVIFVKLNLFAQNKNLTIIPFTTENNGIHFYAKVNENDSIKFLFDTGADGSVINKQSLNKLTLSINGKSLNRGANGTNEVDLSKDNKLTFGQIEKQNVSFTIIPYDITSFDGVFGTDLMKGHIIEIDYDKQQLKFHDEDKNDLDYKNYTKIKLHLIDNYPTIKTSMQINGKRYSGFFGLDSGADDALTILSPYVIKNNLENKMTKIGSASAQGSDGKILESPVVLCPELIFANKILYNVPMILSTAKEGIDATDKMVGIFGNAFLKKFNTIIDFKNGYIYYKLNKNLYTKFY